MLDPLTGASVGRTISRTETEAVKPWPDDCFIQGGGHGVVGVQSPEPGQPNVYRTAFVEVFPPGGGFVRGEGATVTEAEEKCWEKYQTFLTCPGPTGQHDYQPGYLSKSNDWIPYRNGAGFCRHCHAFSSGKFTAAQLEQYCAVCRTPTKWWWHTPAGRPTLFLCEEHMLPEGTRLYGEGLDQVVDSHIATLTP